MHIPRFYLEQAIQTGETLLLTDSSAHHIQSVLRMRQGEKLILFNGNDSEYDATIIDFAKRQVQVKVESCRRVNTESRLTLHLALGMMRGQQMDYAIQKAVELGTSRITPMLTEYSNVKIKQTDVEKKTRHWNSIIKSATEQCGRTQFTQLAQPLNFREVIAHKKAKTNLILHPNANQSLLMEQINNEQSEVFIMIGPEGGFSEQEVDAAITSGFTAISLGPRILRADTAAITALTLCQSQWGDLKTTHATEIT